MLRRPTSPRKQNCGHAAVGCNEAQVVTGVIGHDIPGLLGRATAVRICQSCPGCEIVSVPDLSQARAILILILLAFLSLELSWIFEQIFVVLVLQECFPEGFAIL